MTTQRQFVYAGCIGLLICLTCMGVAQLPHCDNAMMLMLPGILIAALAVPQGIHSYNPYLYVFLAGLINSFLYGVIALLILRGRSNASIAKASIVTALLATLSLTGCSVTKLESSSDTATIHVETLADYPTTIKSLRIAPSASPNTPVFAVEGVTDRFQIHEFVFHSGLNQTRLDEPPSDSYRILTPVGGETFALATNTKYTVTVCKPHHLLCDKEEFSFSK